MSKRHPEELAFLKAELIDRISTGTITSDVLTDLGMRWSELRALCKSDPAFTRQLAEAQEDCTELKADGLLTIHERIPDPKRAMVASRNIERWCSWRNPKTFGNKPEDNNSQPALLEILRAAIARVAIPQQQPVALIEQRPDSDQQ